MAELNTGSFARPWLLFVWGRKGEGDVREE
jgi:hypothetical protein